MAVHILPKWFEVRFFAPGKSYDNADEFYAAMNVTLFGGLAEGSMAVGRQDMTRNDMRELCVRLYEAGARQFRMYREKGRSVPFGQKVWEGDVDTLWQVDLDSLPFLRRQAIQDVVNA